MLAPSLKLLGGGGCPPPLPTPMICLRKSDVTVQRISVCNVTEKIKVHGIHCLSLSYTNDVIDLLP